MWGIVPEIAYSAFDSFELLGSLFLHVFPLPLEPVGIFSLILNMILVSNHYHGAMENKHGFLCMCCVCD